MNSLTSIKDNYFDRGHSRAKSENYSLALSKQSLAWRFDIIYAKNMIQYNLSKCIIIK